MMVNMVNIPAKFQNISIVIVRVLSSKHRCAKVQPHRAANVTVVPQSCWTEPC